MEPITNRQSCFVIAPLGTPITAFLETLRKSRFEPFFISDFLTARQKAFSQVRTAFKSVDFVIGLLFSGYPLENTFFELGVALGLARPTIIFADYDTRISDAFGGFEIHRTDLSDLNQLIPAIESFLKPKRSIQDMRPVYERQIAR